MQRPSLASCLSLLHPWVLGRGEGGETLVGASAESFINLHKYADEQRDRASACRR